MLSGFEMGFRDDQIVLLCYHGNEIKIQGFCRGKDAQSLHPLCR